MSPAHARMQNAERRLAEAQCKKDRAERHLAEAQASAGEAAAELVAATAEYEEERAHQARCNPEPPSFLPKDFIDEVFNLRAVAQLDPYGNVVLPAHMVQAVFLASPRPPRARGTPHP